MAITVDVACHRAALNVRGPDWRPLWVLLLGVACIALLQWSNLDLRLADLLYAKQGLAWRLRHSPLLANLLHRRMQQATHLLFVATVMATLVSHLRRRTDRWRARLLYATLAMSSCFLLVTAGKALLPVPCPWDLQRYGGFLPVGGWLQWQSIDARFAGCFPSGHATSGYALFAWYFVARDARCPWAAWVLLAALAAGTCFGLVQQVRGAHFVSHDVAAAVVCWASCAFLARALLAEGARGDDAR